MNIHCAHDKICPLEEIIPNPKNPNKHPKEQIELLAKIMKAQGIRAPITVSNRSGFITKGHGRLEAAQLNGYDSYPVDFQDYENEAMEYADMVADNKLAELAKTDLSMVNEAILDLGPELEIDLLGIPGFEVEPLDRLDPQSDEDDVPQEPAIPTTKPGDLYKLGRHRLLCGDCTNPDDIERLFNGQKADFCFTSPPYSDQREYEGGKNLDTTHLAKFFIAPCDLFSVNLGMKRKSHEVVSYWEDYIKVAKECGYKFLSWNIWDKGESGSIGLQTAMFPIENEWIFVFGKEKKLNKTIPCKWANSKSTANSRRQKDGTLVQVLDYNVGSFKPLGSISRITPLKARNLGYDHPAMFPVELPEQYILACTNMGDVVYEPFTGSGTTLIAAEKTDRNCLAMELEPKYCDVIVKRWEKYTGKKAELING